MTTLDQALEHHKAGRLEEAEAAYRELLAREPEHADALHWLGVMAYQLGQHETAVELIGRALALNPNYVEAHNNLGLALRARGQMTQAVSAYRQALALAPDDPEVYNNLGIALADHGDINEAIAAFERAVTLSPDFAEAHFNIGTNLLLKGEFEQGWQKYEWRLRSEEQKERSGTCDFPRPRWHGSAFPGKTLLVHTEQGFGDTLQFVRYLPLVKERGGQVLLACQPQLRRLLERCGGVDALVGDPQQPLQDIHFDEHVALASLPGIFGTRLDTIPTEVPYLQMAPELARTWGARVDPGNFSVGIVWAGSRDPNPYRSCTVTALAPLAGITGIHFYSLQKGAASSELAQLPDNMQLTDFTAELRDFADTAALMVNLDLVISVDTAVAHLAGALGRPVWTLLPYVPDWRWLLEREDCPWYPTMRIFRQPRTKDWSSVIQRVSAELERASQRGRPETAGTQ